MPLFDPQTGKLLDPDGLASVHFGKPNSPASKVIDGKKVTRVQNEDTGGTSGYQIEHKTGRLDAVATPDPVQLTLKTQE